MGIIEKQKFGAWRWGMGGVGRERRGIILWVNFWGSDLESCLGRN